jgi:hypothetical protein
VVDAQVGVGGKPNLNEVGVQRSGAAILRLLEALSLSWSSGGPRVATVFPDRSTSDEQAAFEVPSRVPPLVRGFTSSAEDDVEEAVGGKGVFSVEVDDILSMLERGDRLTDRRKK